MEEWREVHEFPDYSVSDRGRVRNDRADRLMALTVNQGGIVQAGFSSNGKYFKRSVALLVATTFLPRPMGPFDTPINVDGDRLNNEVENLMWRPRWFAIRYHQQFYRRYHTPIYHKIIDLRTKEISEGSWEACVRYGLIEKELVYAIHNRTYVWPTYQEFRICSD